MKIYDNPEALLIHGGGLSIHGGDISLTAGGEARTMQGVATYNSGGVNYLVFSGGNAHGDTLATSEAKLGADLAVRAGVPHNKIVCEEDSSSTIGNWANSIPLIQQLGVESVAGITGSLASHRASFIGKQLIFSYAPELELSGYIKSAEHEGLIAYPREAAALLLTRRCLKQASTDDIKLSDLDQYFSTMKQKNGISRIKRRFAVYSKS
jgi:uncharacterized SAM-binding protein YcdF (DUF218 family)